MWEFALITNLLVAVAYAGVTHHIGIHLTRTRQWTHNVLAATVAIFFASCSVNHLAHSVRLLLQPEWRSIWTWHMLAVDSLTAVFGLWYFYERFRSPKMSRGAALFEDSAVRRRDAMEIQDNVTQGLITARYALDRGDARAADAAVEAAIESARRVITELLPAGSTPSLRRLP